MTFAVNKGVIHTYSLSGIRVAFEKPAVKYMVTIRPEELSELMQTLNATNLQVVTRALVEWQLHTMTRSNKAAKAGGRKSTLIKGFG